MTPAHRLVLTCDNVRPRALDEYYLDRAVVARALRECGAARVFEIGHLRAPGISDMDLVACFPDDFHWQTLPRSTPRVLRRLPETFLHPPWVIRERHLERVGALFALSGMCDLDTGEQPLPPQSAAERVLWNVEACCSVLAMFAARRARSTTRSALCLLNGIKYNLALAERDGIRPEDSSRYASAIVELRREWWSLPAQVRESRLVELWSRGAALLEQLLDAYGELVVLRYGLRGGGDFDLHIPGTRLVYRFETHAPGSRVNGRARAGLLHVPATLGPLFRLLAAPEGGLDRWLKPREHAPHALRAIEVLPDFEAATWRYARANAEYLDDVVRCHLPFLPLNGGTLAHLKSSRAGGLRALARRVARGLFSV